MRGWDGAFTADELAAAVPTVHQATVYRTLALLEEIGALRHVHLSHGAAIYEPAGGPPMRHLVCEVCDRHVAVPASVFAGVSAALAAEHDFVLEGAHFAIVGRCASCAADLTQSVVTLAATNLDLRPARIYGRGAVTGDRRSMLAMHIPDGFLDGPTSLVAAVIALAGVAWCLRRTSATLDERDIPVVGLAAAFVFAAQMLNFPVANGTSGHFFGGVLAAVLVGPFAGALAVTVVLAVQALLFADGGLSALGLNIVNMALVGAFAGYGIFLVLRQAARQHDSLGRRRRPGSPPSSPRCWRRSPSSSSTPSAATTPCRSSSVAGGDDRRPRPHRHR